VSAVVHVRDEGGAITVTAVGIMIASILFLSLVLAVGDFLVHKRHLQAQADAAALAAARDMAFPCTSATVAKVNTRVAQYGDSLNPQLENAEPNVHLVVNKPTYYGQSTTDDTPDASPCDSMMVDVKATEADHRSVMGFGIVPFINAHARVQLFQATSFSGSLPIAVPDPTPKKVRAFFIDESDGSTIASAELGKGTPSGGNAIWTSGGDTIPVNVGTKSRIGLRLALSGGSTTTCGDPLVNCYDYDSAVGTDAAPAQKGLVFIRGYSNDGTVGRLADAPKVRQATLQTTAPCPDAYFSVATTCTVGLIAKVDFGTGGADPGAAPAAGGASASLRAVVNGTNYTMTWSSSTNLWTSAQTIPVPAGGGGVPVTLEWGRLAGKMSDGDPNTTDPDCNTNGDPFKNNNPCHGSLGTVQRAFSGNDIRSGPIQAVQVSQGAALANSLRQCDSTNTACTYNLAVSVAIKGSLEVAKNATDPPVAMRIADQNQTQALDCDPAISTLADELVKGCGPRYKPNAGTTCPKKNPLWASAQPWQCVAISTGGATNQIPSGLNQRILGDPKATVCNHPNRYKVDFGIWDEDKDPRVVRLVLVPFGAFSGTGTDSTVPVTTFAQFYITGWAGSGGGFANPCETNDIPSDPQLRDDNPGGSGFMVGHFIQYIDSINSDTDQTSGCDPTSLTPCVGVLTR
jgi:hypothetical protein